MSDTRSGTRSDIRKGQAGNPLGHDEFLRRFRRSFDDPAFDDTRQQIDQVGEIAWQAYAQGRKSPRTRPAGEGFADPGQPLPIEWLDTRERIGRAEQRRQDPGAATRALLVCGSPRNDGSCPGEMSKTYRLTQMARAEFEAQGVEPQVLDLSRLTSEYGLRIHPCKACVSTAMPLCHWPCSCYPNHALGQVDDWMAEIYEAWAAAHAVVLLTPVHWYHTSSALKLMIDRLVCADGGNPDPTSTGGKDVARAKALELAGWPYPKHLAGRAYGLVVHGDVQGVLEVRRALSDWLDWMGLIDAGEQARLDRFIGYYEPYATSHEALDRDEALEHEVREVVQAVAHVTREIRAGRLARNDLMIARARPK
ncbi:MAG: flavodoxin family protein [Burkholderiaceae bacterium]